MGKGKRGHDEVDTYEEDDFVENDDGTARKSKKTKKAASSSSKEDKFWELSNGKNPRRLNVAEFKGAKLVNIREYYEKDGEYKPASKGISLSIDQYKALLKAIPEMNAHLKSIGVDVSGSAVSEDDASEEDTKPQKRVKAKKQEKANIEATSDEEE